MLNIPTLKEIEKWSSDWKHVKQFIQLSKLIEKGHQKIDAQNSQPQETAAEESTHTEANLDQTEGEAVVQSMIHKLVDAVLVRDKQARERKQQAIDTVATVYKTEHLSPLKRALGSALADLDLEPPWSQGNQASGKYHNEDTALIPLAIRFLRGLRELKENNFHAFMLPGRQDGQEENAKAHLQDTYCLTFYTPNPRPSSNTDLEALCRRIMHQDQPNEAPNLFRPKYPVMLRSAGVAMMTYLIEQSGSFSQQDKLRLIEVSVRIPSYGLFKAACADLNEAEIKTLPWVDMTKIAIEKGDADVIKDCVTHLNNQENIHDASWIEITKIAFIKGDADVIKVCVANLSNRIAIDDELWIEIIKIAFEKGARNIIQAFMPYTHNNQRLRNFVFMMAVMHCRDGVVEQMICDGLDVNTAHQLLDGVKVKCLVVGLMEEFIGDHQQTALMLASTRRSLTIVMRLLGAGAEINASDKFGNTALMKASRIPVVYEGGHPGIVHTLITAGADVHAADRRGRSALIKACWATSDDWDSQMTVEHLLNAGSNINAKSHDGKTVLMHACYKGLTWRVEALMATEQTIDIDAIDHEGNTALMWACIGQNHEIVRHLIQVGANINVRNNHGDTALTIAERRDLYELYDVLRHPQNEIQLA